MMHELQPGDPQLIGPYRLRGRLGAGGMGQVYLGLSPGGRAVAVKVIRADLAQDPEFRAGFRREIAVARKVSGLFTAPVIDADVDGPLPWLATAYVAGPSLADAVSQHGPLPPRSVLALAAGLAEGLAAIHAAGVVHRDLKPANVLLAEDGPRVIDFGISRAVETSALTHTGLVVGSPGFMSPEQAEGREAGPPSDIFSLGAVLAYAATGQGPFGTGSTPALVYRVVHSPPNLDNLPAELRPPIEHCLAKDPAQRPTPTQLLAGASYPATGWLPEPVTRAFRVSAPLTVSTARRPAVASAGAQGDGRVRGRAGRRPWRSHWRPLTAAGILAGLAGAGIAAGVTMTGSSPPTHAAQSVQRAAGSVPVQANRPASAPDLSVSSSPTTAAPTRSAPAYTQAPSTPPPAAMTPPPTTSAPPRPSTSPSPSTSSPYSTPPAPTPSTSAPTTPAGY
jgi:serine/threonine protein kinase